MSALEVAFFGALGQEAERKTSKSGREYLRLSVRVGDGDAAQWVSVLGFDASAVGLAESFTRGAHVYIEGRLSTAEWTGQDGRKRFGLSVMSWHTRLAAIGRNKPRKPSEKPISVGTKPNNDFHDDDIPW